MPVSSVQMHECVCGTQMQGSQPSHALLELISAPPVASRPVHTARKLKHAKETVGPVVERWISTHELDRCCRQALVYYSTCILQPLFRKYAKDPPQKNRSLYMQNRKYLLGRDYW
jgi:hypothetical protein